MGKTSLNGRNHAADRERLPDLIKGLAIILVVWGHGIQYGHGGSYDFFQDPIYQWIYGFHMPLFMAISGYLLAGSVQRHESGKILRSKGKSLLVPCLFWGVLMTALDMVQASERLTIPGTVILLLHKILDNFWFLKAVFLACLLVLITQKIFRGNGIVYVLLCVATLFAPSIYNLDIIGYVLPYYFIGFLYGRQGKRLRVGAKVCIAGAVGYLLFQLLFEREYYVYISGMSIMNGSSVWSMLYIDILRFAGGLAGCVFVAGALELLENKMPRFLTEGLCVLGGKTQMIYILSTVILAFVRMIVIKLEICVDTPLALLYDVLVVLPCSGILIVVCCLVEKWTAKWKGLSAVAFGK